ncbi:fatty acid synthase alpha subunit Lsd1, partial [Linderina macrospora]
ETSRKFTITQDHVDRFCSIVSNDVKEYKPSDGQAVSAPMDFLFFAAWPELLRFMLAREAYGGLLNLLHLTNDFKLEESASKLKVGDTVQTAIRADEVVNTDLGKLMKLRATLFVDGVLVATIVSEFLARNTTIDSDLAFKNVETQGVRVSLSSLEDVAVLEAKEWFAYTGDRKLAAGDLVEFSVTSGYRYKAADVFSSVKTSGTVHMVLESGEKVLVGEVDYVGGESFGDPVVEYINSNETAAADASEFQFAHDGLPILSSEPNGKIITVAPADNWTYSHVSGDYNPIHTNGYLADYALLPATITHGMWTSASTRAVVEKYAAGGQPERMRRYAVSFVGMVYPGDRLETTLRHIGFHNGLMVVKGETVSQRGTKVLECTAEIAQPQTAFVFTGQGSQFAGMGMDLYESSAAARSVWDRADTHMRARYGVSLLEIVRKNPTELTVKFGGKRGGYHRRTYQSLVVNAAKADGTDRALFPAITDSSFSYTHRSASGLLNATLFTQPAQTVLSLAYIADLRAKSIVPTRAAFAGHSLGEFGALAATSQLVSVEDAVDIALYRGLLLYSSVARDAHGQSKYAMVAVNLSRVGGGFDEAALELVVGTLREAGGHLLEVINYNVQGMQYIATGHLSQLNALRLAVDAIAAAKVSATTDEGRAAIVQIAKDVLAKADDSALQNSEATTVIAGVDVPSHSSQLAGSVDTFRRVLQSKIHASTVDYARLHKQYIPNVTAKPFEVSRRYFELTRNVTGSPILELELELWDNSALENQAELQRLAHVLVIELLAYQFASPVRWIETQSALLEEVQAARIVEVGPSATLGDMMRRTLRVTGNHSFNGAILHITQQAADVLYAYDPESITPAVADDEEDEVKTEKQQPAPAPVAAPEPVAAPAPVAPVAPVVQAAPSSGPVSDVPIQALDIIQSLIAAKVKKSVGDISPSSCIKDFSGGKSTLQNEIVGDLQKEFGSGIPDKAEDLALSALAGAIGSFGGVLGKHSSALVAKLFGSKMPGGFSQSKVRALLESSYGLGPQRQNALLLHALTLEPSSRLGSESEATAWLDTAAKS